MEMLEDNIVQNKLNSLDTLPEGYTPNLESKWSMLEAGLEANTKTVITWKPIAAAALLLLLGGATLLLQQIKPQPKVTAGQSKPTLLITKAVPQVIPHTTQQTIPVVKHTIKKTHTNQPHFVVNIPDVPATIWEVTAPAVVEPTQEAQVFFTTPVVKVKKQQFVEIDFNDVPASPQQNTEPSIAFRSFKFGIGQQINTTSISHEGRQETAFRLQRSF